MLHSSKIFFLFIFSFSAFGMENDTAPIGSERARTCGNYLDSRIEFELNQPLIQLTGERDPIVLLDRLILHYNNQKSKTRIFDYVTQCKMNITKSFRYINLARNINREIFLAAIKNNNLEEAEQDLQEMGADELSKEVMAREWPLESVKYDLEEQMAKLKNIQEWAKKTAALIPVVEQQDEAFAGVTEKINAQKANIEHSLAILEHRHKVYKMSNDTINFIVKKATKRTLQKTLNELAPVYSLQIINGLYKDRNRNSILHALCDKSLPVDKFKIVVEFFVQSGQNINEINSAGESILDYAQTKQLDPEYITIIKECGGVPLKNLKSAFKKLEATNAPQKILKISDDNPDKKEREEERALTQAMGHL